MKILVVDDCVNKIKNIVSVLLSVSGVKKNDVEYCNDIMSAKSKIRNTIYDLLILDLNMPMEIVSDPSSHSGIELIDELINSTVFMFPLNICVITEYTELELEYKEKKLDFYFPIIMYNPLSTEWEKRLKAKVEIIKKMENDRNDSTELFDVALITAVKVESDNVKKVFGICESFSMPNDPTIYYKTEIEKDGNNISLVFAEQATMGMVSATSLATKMIFHFSPKYIIMSGIAAGIGNNNYGDIIFPKDVYDYSSGKYIKKSKKNGDSYIDFEPDPKFSSLRSNIYEKSKLDYSSVLFRIKQNYNGKKPSTDLSLIPSGAMACGTSVIANSDIVEELIKKHVRKAIGLDMESYGIFYATESINTACIPICIKSICDFANENKSDDFQSYAAYTSASFTKFFIENELEF